MRLVTPLLLGLVATCASAAQMAYETVLSALPVDAQGDQTVFATPFDYRAGKVFTVHVEPPPQASNGANLQTVVRKGTRQADARWTWESQVIESRTLLDPWHTQASIALDKTGRVHVAYNMHNMPWQYAVSAAAYSIDTFEFRGQAITQAELNTVKFENRTPFPHLGTGAIPGTQITYPMFFKDRADELYVTYRFALKPARAWALRAFGAGVARYDTPTGQWQALGGPVPINSQDATLPAGQSQATQTAFAYQDGYTAYLPTLGFGPDNALHVFWNWREGEAGMDTTRPSYATSADGRHFFNTDGSTLALPADYQRSVSIEGPPALGRFYAVKSVALASDGSPMVIVQSLNGDRQLWRRQAATGRFTMEPSPLGASVLVVDKQGREWAFATGLRVLMRPHAGARWQDMGEIGSNLCGPAVQYYPSESRFVVHAKSCDGRLAHLFSFRR